MENYIRWRKRWIRLRYVEKEIVLAYNHFNRVAKPR